MTSAAKYRTYLIFILPLLFLVVGIIFNRAKYINDPDYIYIVNALVICDGNSVGHVDNPGTTVMQIAAAVMAVMHLFSNPENETLINHVLGDPDKFVEGIRLVFVFLNTLVLFLLGWVTLKKTKSIWVALLLQISCFISANALDHIWSKVSPEPLLFSIVGIYVITVLYYYFERKKDNWKYIILFSIITGAGLATKATFLPLIVFPLVIIPGVRKKLIYFVGIIPAFVLFTIPAVTEYKDMFYWFRNLISHSGIYGQGKSNFINLNDYFPEIGRILENNPFLLIIILGGIILLFIRKVNGRNSDTDWNIKFLTGLIFTLIAGVLLVAKHYGANHYLLPELLLTGITFFFILNVLTDLKPLQKIKPYLLPAVVIVIGTILLLRQPRTLYQTNKNYRDSTQEIDSTNLMVENEYSDFGIINYYEFSLNKYTALKFGDIYAKGRIRTHLYEKYPNTFFYDFYNNKFQNWDKDVPLSEIVDLFHGKILLMNGPTDESTLKEMAARGFPLNQIYKGNVQNIFMFDTLRFNMYRANKTENFKIFDTFDAEKTNENNTEFLSYNSKMIGSSVSQSTEEAKSEKHSVKMDKEIQFAIEYRIDSLNAGDSYEVDIWRKSTTTEAFLVISSKEQEVFYKAQNTPIESSTDGWKLIRAEFVVTEEMSKQPLYIYLWNPQKQTVYFDDLLIKIANNDSLK